MRKRGHHHPNKRVFVQVTTGHDRHVILRNNTRSKRRSSTSMHPRTLGRPRDKHQNYIQNELRSKHQNYIQNELRSLQAFIKVWPSPRNNTQLGGGGDEIKVDASAQDSVQDIAQDPVQDIAQGKPAPAPAPDADNDGDGGNGSVSETEQDEAQNAQASKTDADTLIKKDQWVHIYKTYPSQSMVALYYRMIMLYDAILNRSFKDNLLTTIKDAGFIITVDGTDITVKDKTSAIVSYKIKVIDEIIKDTTNSKQGVSILNKVRKLFGSGKKS